MSSSDSEEEPHKDANICIDHEIKRGRLIERWLKHMVLSVGHEDTIIKMVSDEKQR
jgi:hypothetical protein